MHIRDMRRLPYSERRRITAEIGKHDRLAEQVLRYAFCGRRPCSWAKVAMLIGGNNTPDGVRMIAARVLADIPLQKEKGQ